MLDPPWLPASLFWPPGGVVAPVERTQNIRPCKSIATWQIRVCSREAKTNSKISFTNSINGKVSNNRYHFAIVSLSVNELQGITA